jgi:SsrA-binding protein
MTTYINNKKAGFNFEILEKYEAGISLLGTEVKSVRKGQGKLEGAYVLIRGGEAFLVGASIPPYQSANAPVDFEADRPRKLLLNKKELSTLERESETAGLTLVPIRLYNAGRVLKLELAVARGKKQFDKRQTIKARDVARDLKREHKYQ